MKKAKILIIEDNEGDVLLLKEAFEEIGNKAQLEFIKNGRDAMHSLFGHSEKSKLPDLILLDLNLPMKSGMEILIAIKNSPHHKHIPTIILTTSSAVKDIHDSYDNHANCYITKPIDINDYYHSIAKIHQYWLNFAQLPS
jgi:CheY-like chemotaxis protein